MAEQRVTEADDPIPAEQVIGGYALEGWGEIMTRQRVPDEQLTEWERAHKAVAERGGFPEGRLLMVIADLRESRAREAALVAELVASSNRLFDAKTQAASYYERGLEFVREAELVAAERDEMRANWQAALAAETVVAAERDGLQQHIDKALESLPDASTYTVGAENALRVVFLLLDDIATARAALTGTEDTNG